ncbi:hypothetical protein [Providencia huaxiensis]
MRQGVALPLVGVTASVPLEVRIESLEPYINDQFMPGIVFDPKLTLLLSELDTWPEPQSGHHYDGLSALHILWMIAVSRGAGNFEWQPVPNRGDSSHHGDDYFMDDADGSSFGRELW